MTIHTWQQKAATGLTFLMVVFTVGLISNHPALAYQYNCKSPYWASTVNPVGAVTADNSAYFSWQQPADQFQTHFVVQFRRYNNTSGWGSWSESQLLGSQTSFQVPFITAVEQSTRIQIGVSGWCSGGPPGLESQFATVRSTSPASPLDVRASVVGGFVDVSWAGPEDWGGASELTYRVSTSPPSASCEVVDVGACRLEGVPRGVPLTVSVTASNPAGTSAPAVSAPVGVAVTAPDPPGVVTAKYPKAGTAKVSWTAPANNGGKPITGYVVTSSPGKKSCSTTGKQACVVKGLTGGKAYSFTVKATNAIGTSKASPAGVAGVLVGPASAPQDAKAAASGGSAKISWAKPRKSGGGKLVQYIARAGSSSCTTKKNTCTISGLALGRTYQVTVTAVTTGGRSKPATTTVTTIAPVPVKPQQDIT